MKAGLGYGGRALSQISLCTFTSNTL